MRERLIAPLPLVAAARVQPREAGRWDVMSQVAAFVARQTVACPQKHGGPLRTARFGPLDARECVDRATISGTTAERARRIAPDRRVARVGR